MKTNILINRLKDLRDKGECVSETAVLEQTIKSIEALEKIKEEIDGLMNDSFSYSYDNGVLDCLEIIDKHLSEVEND